MSHEERFPSPNAESALGQNCTGERFGLLLTVLHGLLLCVLLGGATTMGLFLSVLLGGYRDESFLEGAYGFCRYEPSSECASRVILLRRRIYGCCLGVAVRFCVNWGSSVTRRREKGLYLGVAVRTL